MSTRIDILHAADTLFGRNGFDSTSIRHIAEYSGLNKSLIHYHFKNKEELLLSVLEQYYTRLFNTIKEAIQSPGTFKERMMGLVNVYFDFLSENINFSKIVQREASSGKHVKRIRSHMLPFFKIGVTFIQHAFPETKKSSMAAEQILISIYGMIVSYFSYSEVLEPLIGESPLSENNLARRKQHIQEMLTLLLNHLESED